MTLFAVEAIYYETQKCKAARAIVMIVGCIFPFLFQGKVTPFMILFMRTILGFFYFMIGYLFWDEYKRYSDHLTHKKSLMTGICFIAVGCIMAVFCQYRIEFFTGSFSNGMVAIPVSLLFSFGIIVCCYTIRDSDSSLLKMIQHFGRESLLIMLIHPTILLFFTYPLAGWFVSLQGLQSFIASIILFVIVLLLNIPAFYIINKWLPILKGK